jgi:hypothetical protein
MGPFPAACSLDAALIELLAALYFDKLPDQVPRASAPPARSLTMGVTRQVGQLAPDGVAVTQGSPLVRLAGLTCCSRSRTLMTVLADQGALSADRRG